MSVGGWGGPAEPMGLGGGSGQVMAVSQVLLGTPGSEPLAGGWLLVLAPGE